MDRKSLMALLGILAVAGYQNRDNITATLREMTSGGQPQGSGAQPGGAAPQADGGLGGLLGGMLDVGCPVRILQGVQDEDVPWQHAFKLTHCLPSDDVVLTLVQDGDHRLSRPQDIARILAAVTELAAG